MKKLILKNGYSPGDIVMLTAAVRDLHRTYPDQFLTDVRTPCPDLWLNNPYITPIREDDPEATVLECDYPLINRCDVAPYHCLHGFVEFLNDRLGLHIRPTEFRGDIHLSLREKSWYSQVHELTGDATPFWIIVAGGKIDVTIKWWSAARFQAVVDHFHGRIQFVQAGAVGPHHFHPRLDGVIDLRGRTNLRELVRLVHHAQGVLCPVTCVMHLAAAVERRVGESGLRPCVVIAGGREPPHWEAYPGHHFLHTLGALPCCALQACWRARTVPLCDGDERDAPGSCCADVAEDLPRCMHLITAEDVIRRIETCFEGGAAKYLTPTQAAAAAKGVAATRSNPKAVVELSAHNVRAAMDDYIRTIPSYPGGFKGRGIVICGGGLKYFTPAWVCLRLLRRLGCRLPIQLWHVGKRELSPPMAALVTPYDVECVDAAAVAQTLGVRCPSGWPLKPFAMLHAPFREVLFLDADNVPLVDPEFLFETPAYRETGAIFWPDFDGHEMDPRILDLCGVPRAEARALESGQIVIDKERCWRELNLAGWCNEHSGFFYKFMYGDKETFGLAFRKLRRPYAMPTKPLHHLRDTMCQHDFEGRRIFQHRNTDKWDLFGSNRPDPGFEREEECFELLRELRETWDGRAGEIRTWRNPGWLHAVSPSPARTPTFQAAMITCPERQAMVQETLARLRRSDWGERPVHVQLDEGQSSDRVARISAVARLALSWLAEQNADYALLFEDDVDFNRHFLENLLAWAPLQHDEVTLASLCNFGIPPLAGDPRRHFIVADPLSMHGSQGYLISREALRFILDHWNEAPVPLDLKVLELAGRFGPPLLYHSPSLVQHIGRESIWGGDWRDSPDFDPLWRASSHPLGRI